MSLKIIIDNKEAVLPSDIELDIKMYNYFFKDKNEDATYPLVLNLHSNRHIFGFPERYNKKEIKTEYPAKAFFTPYTLLDGRCVVTDVSNDEIEIFLTTDKTSFWGRCKNVYLDHLDLGRENFASVEEMMSAFTASLKGGKDYVVCPLYDPYVPNIYLELYEPFYNYLQPTPDTSGTFKREILPMGNGKCVFTPFVRLTRLITKALTAMGYRIVRNDFDSDTGINDVLVVCRANGMHSYNIKPYFDYNKHVPHILMSTFLQEIEDKFGVRFVTHDSNKNISVISLQKPENYFTVKTLDWLQKHIVEDDDKKKNFIFKDKENPDFYIQKHYENGDLEYTYGSDEDPESIECMSAIVGWNSTDVKVGYVNNMAVGANYENDQAYLNTIASELRFAVYRGYILCNTDAEHYYYPYPIASAEPLKSTSTINNMSLLWWGVDNLFDRYHHKYVEIISGIQVENEMVLINDCSYLNNPAKFFSDLVATRNRLFRCYEQEIKISKDSVTEHVIRCYPA